MAKTHRQIEEERRQKWEERRKYLMELPGIYKRDFNEAFKRYLKREFPEIDPDDPVVQFDPELRDGFTKNWPEEAIELSQKYNLVPIWDPEGDDPPNPVTESAARYIRCQDGRIWPNQIQKDRIINLSPHKRRARFLIIEIDLSKPKKEIETSIMAIVDQKRKQVKVSGFHHELVSPPEPRDKESSYIFDKMEVWEMVEKERQSHNEKEINILWRIAKVKTSETIESTDEKKSNREERRIYNALINAYNRDKKIYFGK